MSESTFTVRVPKKELNSKQLRDLVKEAVVNRLRRQRGYTRVDLESVRVGYHNAQTKR